MAQDHSDISMFMESFNKVSALYGTDLNSAMAEVAIEILAMPDSFSGNKLTFFDKGALLLSYELPKGLSNEDIRACMFWWVFNEELMELTVKDLIEPKSKI